MLTLCVLNWNAVSLSNSEPLHCGLIRFHFSSIWIFKWRASLVPAAAVIPAPLAYTIIVAVKRLVVGLNTYLYYIVTLYILCVLPFLVYFISIHAFGRHIFYLTLIIYISLWYTYYILYIFSTLWTNQSVSNMSFLNVHWMSYHGMLHFQPVKNYYVHTLRITFTHIHTRCSSCKLIIRYVKNS